MVMIAVKVPAGAVPGDKVDAVYDGRRVSFVVPPSVRPGQSVHVPVPASDNRKGSPELQARLQKLRATSSRKLKTPSPTTPSSSPLLLFTKKTPPAKKTKSAPRAVVSPRTPASTPLTDLGDDVYEFERILSRRKRGRGEQLLIKWRGFGEDEATWEPARNILVDAPPRSPRVAS